MEKTREQELEQQVLQLQEALEQNKKPKKSRGFQVRLLMDEDDDMRAYIKDLVKGQVKSIVKEEVAAMVDVVFTKRIRDNASLRDIDRMVDNEIKKTVSDVLKTGTYNDGFIKNVAKHLIEEEVKKVFAHYKGN